MSTIISVIVLVWVRVVSLIMILIGIQVWSRLVFVACSVVRVVRRNRVR